MSRASYLSELHRLRQRLDSLLDEALAGSEYDAVAAGTPGTWKPTVDLVETARAYVLLAELPGVEREDIELEVRGRRLILSGRRTAPEDGTFHRMERSFGPFHRAFELEHDMDREAIQARLDRGLLRVDVPKKGGSRVRVAAESSNA